jgi:NAD-dependent dihydropyrimidine dehydrogenase PreA subunit
MYMTGAVKNLFGLVPGLGKSPYHLKYSGRDQFADMLIDLNSILSPVIHIMDAVISMEGEGPSNGNPKKTGILLAAKNPYSMDLAALRIMGEDSEQIPVMRRAHSRGFLPSFDSRTLTYPLEAAENVAAEDFKLIPKRGKNGFLAIAASYFMRIFPSGKHPEPAPYIEQSRCIACLACFEICPADAVKKKNSAQGKNTLLEIESRSCIRCYCCHEVCPVHAVKVDSDKSLKS